MRRLLLLRLLLLLFSVGVVGEQDVGGGNDVGRNDVRTRVTRRRKRGGGKLGERRRTNGLRGEMMEMLLRLLLLLLFMFVR